jgi:protein SCO1/2
MAEMASVMQKLGPQADQVQVLFITLDPERDTQELLAGYVPAFDKRFLGLRGTPEQTARTAKDFKVFYTKVPGSDPKSYTIDHSAGTYVFDRDGKLRLFMRHDETADEIVHDVRQLLS